ncbi:hypothetical protein [Neptunicella sp. SCSIO 80796]|uniref:hypothetical protein n=1 Tax=Neptunicella plasticusilytica TaxID=3117012 RepID=UPI003A4D40BD
MNKKKAIEQGRKDFETGVFRRLNPYKSGWRRKYWFQGWDSASWGEEREDYDLE